MTNQYAGDLPSPDAWARLCENPDTVILDVRTQAEWNWVGIPDLSSLNKNLHCVEWVKFPGGIQNTEFLQHVTQILPDKNQEILILCRSGVRSKHAAIALSAVGYTKAYNISDGFEGDIDEQGHRSQKNGWKYHQLPWKQS